jgi:hypothetical protein
VANSTSVAPLEVRVSVAMEVRPTYGLGEAMPATIRVQNTSDHEVELPAIMGAPRYWLDLFVYGPDGREVTWRAHPPLIGGWKTKKNVPPGAAESASVDLNLVFSIEKVGTYEVKATFGSPPSLSERPYRIVVSPLYKFTVQSETKESHGP